MGETENIRERQREVIKKREKMDIEKESEENVEQLRQGSGWIYEKGERFKMMKEGKGT